MTDPLRFVPPRVALVDPRTGMVAREWYLFFQGVFNRIGGATGESTTDIVASLFEDAGSSETNATLFATEQALSQYPAVHENTVLLDGVAQALAQLPPDTPTLTVESLSAELATVRDQVSELVKEIQSLRQGLYP